MPNKNIGEFKIPLSLITRPQELSATFDGDELPHVTALREKCAPLVAEYGREVHGHTFNLSSRWNGHDGLVGFIVTVDEGSQVNDFESAKFSAWLISKRNALLGIKVEEDGFNVVAGDSTEATGVVGDQRPMEAPLSTGSDQKGPPPVSTPGESTAAGDDAIVNFESVAQGGITTPTSTSLDESQPSSNVFNSPGLSEALVNQVINLKRQNYMANRKPCFDVVESITLGFIVDAGLDSILIEAGEFITGIVVGASLEDLSLLRTEEKSIAVKEIWPSTEWLIELAQPNEKDK